VRAFAAIVAFVVTGCGFELPCQFETHGVCIAVDPVDPPSEPPDPAAWARAIEDSLHHWDTDPDAASGWTIVVRHEGSSIECGDAKEALGCTAT
jgi:hypothetical protein